MNPSALALNFKKVLFDLDGVLYRGTAVIAGAATTVGEITTAGVQVGFVTNNASRTPEQVGAHLSDLGIPARAEDVFTSSQAAARIAVDMFGVGSRVFVVGGDGIDHALAAEGLVPQRNSSGAVGVVQGFGPDLRWSDLAEASYAISSGLPWIATNLDSTFPTKEGIAPGNGSLVDAVAHAVGHRPNAVAGKPAPALLQLAMAGLDPTEVLFVGDRFDTDIAGGLALGLPTLFVLSGVGTVSDLWQSRIKTDYIATDVSTLTDAYPEVLVTGDRALSKGAHAILDRTRGEVRVTGGAHVDQLRVADALKWDLGLIEECATGRISLVVDSHNNDRVQGQVFSSNTEQ